MSLGKLQRVKDRVVQLAGEHKWGLEHNVFIDRLRKRVWKKPNKWAFLWQDVEDEEVEKRLDERGFPERDLKEMRQGGIEVVPTEVHRETMVDIAGKGRVAVAYLLEQELYEASHEMSFADMFHYQKYRDVVHNQACIGLEMKQKKLGLDLLGGKTFKLAPKALDPRVDSVDARIANLLVADGSISASRDWPDFGLNQGDTVAKEGDVRHCDTRLLDFSSRQGFLAKLRRCIRLKDQEVQDTAIWTLLESFGYPLEYNTQKTGFRRKIRWLFNHALPKMRAYAEAVG